MGTWVLIGIAEDEGLVSALASLPSHMLADFGTFQPFFGKLIQRCLNFSPAPVFIITKLYVFPHKFYFLYLLWRNMWKLHIRPSNRARNFMNASTTTNLYTFLNYFLLFFFFLNLYTFFPEFSWNFKVKVRSKKFIKLRNKIVFVQNTR